MAMVIPNAIDRARIPPSPDGSTARSVKCRRLVAKPLRTAGRDGGRAAGRRLRRADMFGARPEAQERRGDPPQKGEAVEQPQRQRRAGTRHRRLGPRRRRHHRPEQRVGGVVAGAGRTGRPRPAAPGPAPARARALPRRVRRRGVRHRRRAAPVWPAASPPRDAASAPPARRPTPTSGRPLHPGYQPAPVPASLRCRRAPEDRRGKPAGLPG